MQVAAEHASFFSIILIIKLRALIIHSYGIISTNNVGPCMFKSNFLQRKMDRLWVYDLKNCDRKLYKHKKRLFHKPFNSKV